MRYDKSSDGEDDRCLHVALPVKTLLEMLTKPATRTGCVHRGLGTPFSRRGSVPAAEDERTPSILQLNTEGPTADKISVIEQHEQGIHHRSIGGPPHNCEQASD